MRSRSIRYFCLLTALVFSAGLGAVNAQSSDQNFPTPVTTSEIRGTIRARDIGDSRVTTYFYAFEGEQGDVFVNIQSRNFNGDIDIFTADTLQPLTKIVLYADTGITETGRIVYLRKSERLLLRIEGRPPGDDPASFVIKFAGSFVALSGSDVPDGGSDPKVPSRDIDGVRLNSAGAVVPGTERPKPVDRDNISTARETESKPEKTLTLKKEVAPKKTETTAQKPKPVRKPPVETAKTVAPPKVVVTSKIPPDPLASIRLIIELKDGTTYEKPMNEVLRFSTDSRGTITVIGKDGKVVRYAITDVAKVTIQ